MHENVIWTVHSTLFKRGVGENDSRSQQYSAVKSQVSQNRIISQVLWLKYVTLDPIRGHSLLNPIFLPTYSLFCLLSNTQIFFLHTFFSYPTCHTYMPKVRTHWWVYLYLCTYFTVCMCVYIPKYTTFLFVFVLEGAPGFYILFLTYVLLHAHLWDKCFLPFIVKMSVNIKQWGQGWGGTS